MNRDSSSTAAEHHCLARFHRNEPNRANDRRGREIDDPGQSFVVLGEDPGVRQFEPDQPEMPCGYTNEPRQKQPVGQRSTCSGWHGE